MQESESTSGEWYINKRANSRVFVSEKNGILELTILLYRREIFALQNELCEKFLD